MKIEIDKEIISMCSEWSLLVGTHDVKHVKRIAWLEEKITAQISAITFVNLLLGSEDK